MDGYTFQAYSTAPSKASLRTDQPKETGFTLEQHSLDYHWVFGPPGEEGQLRSVPRIELVVQRSSEDDSNEIGSHEDGRNI